MHTIQISLFSLLVISNACQVAVGSKTGTCLGFPKNIAVFSSSFQQPPPPSVANNFKAHFIQHKWYVGSDGASALPSQSSKHYMTLHRNQNLSHITTGFLYNSFTAKKVRVDEAYDANIASSIFDYTNTTAEGLVSNILYTFSPTIASPPSIFSDYVNPGFPLFTQDILQSNGAVYTGLTRRDKIGKVVSWSLMYQGAIPVTIFLDDCGTIVGYDFFAPELRTRVVTEFFDIELGEFSDEIFKLPA